MNKHLLLLTAATAALLVGPAFAASSSSTSCDSKDDNSSVSTKITTPLCTRTVKKGKPGNITIEQNGSVEIPSSSGQTIVPAITINSNNNVTLDTGSTVSYKDTDDAVGVQLDAGYKGSLDSSGTIDLTGTGSTKTGILLSGKGTFTGDIDLEAGSTLSVKGDSSTGIEIADHSTLDGNLIVDGAVQTYTSSSTSTTSSTPPVTAIDIAGNVDGDVLIGTGGTVSSVGAGAQGLESTGSISGSLRIITSLEALGTSSPKHGTSNPEAGSALIVGGNVGQGIFIAGPTSSTSSTASAVIETSGTSPTVLISPSVDITPNTLTVGKYRNTSYSFLNRGSILSAPIDPNLGATAVEIGNASKQTIFTGGFYSSGQISALASSSDGSGSTTVDATAVEISSKASIPSFVNSAASAGTGTSNGQITAAISGPSGGAAHGIWIAKISGAKGGSLASLTNDGTISASATTTAKTVAVLDAFAIQDDSGSLDTITNSGTIEANATTLQADNQIADAVDVSANKKGVTFNDSGTVTGDVLFGSGGDTFAVKGTATADADVTGDVDFGGGTKTALDELTVGNHASVIGAITEDSVHNYLDVSVDSGGSLTLSNTTQGLTLDTFTAQKGATLGLTVSQAFDKNAGADVFTGPLLWADASASSTITIKTSAVNISYGSFLSPTAAGNQEQFILMAAPHQQLVISDMQDLRKKFTIPFLYDAGKKGGLQLLENQKLGGQNVDELVLTLRLKTAEELGFAPQSYPAQHNNGLYNATLTALANDDELGAAVVSGVTDRASAQKTFEAFAPNVSGETRAIAISLTDEATGPVAARQRALNMYANQDSETTLWSQQFGESLNQDGTSTGPGFRNSGFGLVIGMDGGDPSDGRYGGALTFFSGSANEKNPRDSKTVEDWYMLTGYTNWRGRGFFFDSQGSVGVAVIDGKRDIDIGDVSRTAQGKRDAEMGALGATTGVIFDWGGTVLSPQISVDGMTMREEGYTESGGGDGFDLHVKPYYADSLRAFAGLDVRQDVKIGSFYLQPELRGGYRYDFLNNGAKTTAYFSGDPNGSTAVAAGTPFTITGPDTTAGNFVGGASIATTTEDWSLGLNYDVLRGTHGDFSQVGTISLIGKI